MPGSVSPRQAGALPGAQLWDAQPQAASLPWATLGSWTTWPPGFGQPSSPGAGLGQFRSSSPKGRGGRRCVRLTEDPQGVGDKGEGAELLPKPLPRWPLQALEIG